MRGLRRLLPHSQRAWCAGVALLAIAATVLGLAGPAGALGVQGAEIVVIDNIQVGSPVMTTYSNCTGYVENDVPVVPVTIEATFIKPPDDPDPTGPYATATWTGGYGSWDDHFGTGQGKSPTQFFHILMRADPHSYYGQGEYTVHVHVQDVGTSPAWSEEDKTVTLPAPPPSGGEAAVKCSFVKPFNLNEKLADLAKSGLKKLAKQACAACVKAYDVAGKVRKFSDLLNHFLDDTAVDDPPDDNYQQIAKPNPPPLLSPPAGLSTTQLAAFTNLEQALAGDIGLARALYTTQNRIWGADNAPSRYWYLRQLAAAADYASRLADALGALPQLFEDLQAAFAPSLSAFTISISDVLGYLADIGSGVDATTAADFTKLGATAEDQQQMIAEALTVDPNQLAFPVDGVRAIFGQAEADWAGPLRALAKWAANSASAQPPVVASVGPRSVPSAGFRQVTIDGVNLGTVTGIDFGPSNPVGGEAQRFSCSATECTAIAPPGHGTVDVVAVGPGGPSQLSTGDRLTYVDPTTPQVTQVFPNSGPTSGATSVSIRGSGLSGGAVYFGPTLADQWQCTDTACTADAPPSVSPQTVDVTVADDAGTSPIVPADRFSYFAGSPPPAQQPVVSGVSPAHGSDLGGDQITITGTHFTGATEVDFGDVGSDWTDEFTVLDDSHILAITPTYYGSAAKTVDVVVHGPWGAGSSAVNAGDEFTFDAKVGPTVTSVSPRSGPDTGGTQVTVIGTNLGGGSTWFEFGNESANGAQCSATTCTVTVPPRSPYTADGPVPVVAWNSDGHSNESLTTADTFTYTKGPRPVVTGISPDTGVVGGGTDVAILGSNLANGTVRFGPTEAEATCTDTACIATSPPSPTGKPTTVDVTVTTNGGTSATLAADQFGYVRLGPPVVASVDPANGWLAGGEEVRIYGSDLTGGTARFGTSTAQAASGSTSCTQTECEVTSPKATSTGPVHVTVTTPSGTSQATSADEYSYLQPTITKISPATGWTSGTTPVTITGTNLAGGNVYFGTNEAGDASCTDTTCTVTAPWTNSTGTVDVRVVQNDYTKSPVTTADRFTYFTRPAPTVTGVTPNTGTDAGKDTVTITGTDLDGGTVRFGTAVAAGTCGHTSCAVTTPAHADGAVDVTVTAAYMTSATTSADVYTYRKAQPPTVTGVSPTHGYTPGGTAVTITGTDLTNGTVSFGGTNASSATCSATSCTATAPAHTAATVDITVRTGVGTSAASSADQFTYQKPPAPTISQIDPAYGPASGGSWVTITGTNLAGASIGFDGHAAPGVKCTQTSCTATAPPHAAGAVTVQITTDGGTATGRFSYTPIMVTEHPIPGVTAATGGGVIVRGLGGDMWFAMPNPGKIGRAAPNGAITTYPTADAGAQPAGLTLGPDGLMWYLEPQQGKAIAIDGTGAVQHAYQLPGLPSDLRRIVTGPDGRLWFTLLGSGAIGAITTSGKITIYHLPNPNVGPYNLVVGPDGRIWFTETWGNAIGAITTSGKITEYPIPDANAQAWDISRGPDNRLWFAEQATPALGAITTSGKVTMYRLPPAPGRNPEGLTYGPDGRMWFAAPNLDQVSALDPATGQVSDYALPGGNGSEQPRYLGMAPDGTLWVTEFGGRNVASISGITSATAPTVTGLSPDHGAVGDQITITGTNLGGTTSVKFGATAASFTIVDPAHLTATVPAGSGSVDVTVTTPTGTSAIGSADQFHYGAAPPVQPAVTAVSPGTGPITGGTRVTITGTDLSGGTVSFGTAAATNVACTATSCTATSPARAAGTVDVTVTTPGGSSDTSAADRFTYLTPPPPKPAVTGISPATGAANGGTSVTITGTNLAQGTVTFGLDAATSVSCTDTTCTATTPRGAPGTLDVRVTTAGGTSARTSADHYTYLADSSTLTIGKATTISYGASLTVSTTLTDTATSTHLAGMIVTLYRRASTTGSWTKVSAKTASSTGAASISVKPTGYSQYQWRFAGTATHAAATSATQAVTVAQVVSIKATKTSIVHGTAFKIYGTVKPSGPGQKVHLQRLAGTTWKTVATATLTKQRLPNGTTTVGYVFTQKLTTKGSYKYRVLKPATATLAKGTSPDIPVTIT